MHDVISIVHLGRYRGTGDDVRPLPVIAGDSETSEWEVEKIEGERNTRAGVELLVKWKGYSDRERTWEPLSHLENAQDALAEWRKTQIAKVGRPAKRRGKDDED